MEIHGIESSSTCIGTGLVNWTVVDNEGTTMILEVVAYVIPKAAVRLFIPQDMLSQNRTGSFNLYWNMVELNFKGIKLKVPYNCSNHLLMLTLDINERCNQYK